MKKTLLIILIINSFYSYSQTFEEGAYINDEFGVNIKSVTFVNQSIGYLITQDNLNSIYYYSADSGKVWQALDTSFNFNANQISHEFGRGIICGSLNNEATIEVFNNDLTSRLQYNFIEYSEIIQISIVATDTLVFLSKNASEEYFIGKITFSGDIPSITSSHSISADNHTEICFHSSDQGWILFQNNLYRTLNCAQSLNLEQTQVLDFTFFDSINGAMLIGVYPENISMKNTVDGGQNWSEIGLYNAGSTYGDLIMNSSHSAFVFSMWTGTSGFFYLDYFDFDEPENPVFQYSTDYDCSPTTWVGYSYNENQTYFFSACGDILYTLNNCNYNNINVENINTCFNIFPNPAKDFIEILLPNNIDPIGMEIYIYDNTGTLVYTKKYYSSNIITVDISNFRKSLFFVNLKKNGYVFNSRFIKI